MAFVDAQALAEGFIAISEGDILAAVSKTTIIPPGGLTLHNVNAANQTILVYANRDGTARPIGRALLEQNWTAINEFRIVLESGDSLRAITTTASAVHYTLSGGEEQ